jgi:hypothetical protein
MEDDTDLALTELDDRSLKNYAKNWSTKWSTRNLEALVALFCDDCIYTDKSLDQTATGKTELRRLLSRHLHRSNLTYDIQSFDTMKSSWPQTITIKWFANGSLLEGVTFPKDRYEFYGSTCLQLNSDKIQTCETRWDTTAGLMDVLMARRTQ